MTENSPGRAACETWQTRRLGVDRTGTWEALSEKARADWEAAAQAAIDWWHAERDLEPPREITVQPDPGETQETYEAYVDTLLDPVREEMARLRTVARRLSEESGKGEDGQS